MSEFTITYEVYEDVDGIRILYLVYKDYGMALEGARTYAASMIKPSNVIIVEVRRNILSEII